MAVLKRDGANGVIAYPKKIFTALADGIIAVGDAVKVQAVLSAGGVATTPAPGTYGAAGFVVTVTANPGECLAFGVAVTAAVDLEEVQIQVSGFTDAVTSVDSIALGDMVSGSASGQVRQYDAASATVQPFAVCVDAIGAGLSDGAILIIDKGWMG